MFKTDLIFNNLLFGGADRIVLYATITCIVRADGERLKFRENVNEK